MSVQTGVLAFDGAAVVLALGDATAVAAKIVGTFNGTLTFQGTVDGSNWDNIPARPLGADENTPAVTTVTAPGLWTLDCGGFQVVQAIMHPYSSGSATVTLSATDFGGLGVFRVLDLQPAAATVKNGRGQLYGWYISNHNTSTSRYVKFYNKSAAGSSDAPFMTFELTPGAVANLAIPQGIPFTTALSVRGTTGVADSDTGAPNANDIVCSFFYT